MPHTFKVNYDYYSNHDAQRDIPTDIVESCPMASLTVVADDAADAISKLTKHELSEEWEDDELDDDGLPTGKKLQLRVVKVLVHSVEKISNRIDIG